MDILDYMDKLDSLDELDAMDVEIAYMFEGYPRKRTAKTYKTRYNPLQLSDEDFKEEYRFSKEYFKRICSIVKDDVKRDSRGGGVPTELQVLIALKTWSCQEGQDNAADLHGVSQRSITNICRRVARALIQKSDKYIKMPASISEQEQVSQAFRSISRFGGVIGAIGSTHIKIKKVSGESGQGYVNRKGFASLNVQCVCDASLRIMDIVVSKGSVHSSSIFHESNLRRRMENGEFQGRLLGDPGYELTPYLFTPVLHPRTAKEEEYNHSHSRTSSVLEHFFTVWKQRFRCLLRGFSVSLENAKLYTSAMAVLHNIALDMKEELDESNEGDLAQEALRPEPVSSGKYAGQAARGAFIEINF